MAAEAADSDDGTSTGGDVYTGPALSMSDEDAQHRAEVLAQYMEMSGKKLVSDDEIVELADDLGIAAELEDASEDLEVAAQLSTKSTATTALAATTSSVAGSILLNIDQVPQSKGYYCGPAVGVEIIRAPIFGSMKSAADGSSIKQSTMANSNHMKTTANGTTAWASKNFKNGLNAWIGKTVYHQYSTPPAAEVKAAVTTRLMAGYPVAADTVELAGDDNPHYNNHPHRKIGHWIVAYYYSNSGKYTWWVDSTANSTAVTGFEDAKPKFKSTTANFTNKYLQYNGIAY
ncbi:hypothetical protein [Demequina sp. NBRC 110054]|uniref:hypothetical protein n=1 Tax=Demequina sp. NBRC 110054 TaxID=1570343 RepID=UPI001178096E|nr:hypothetical protein [Demequina sp. NBRC 110054]